MEPRSIHRSQLPRPYRSVLGGCLISPITLGERFYTQFVRPCLMSFKTMCTWDEKYNMCMGTTFERKASSRLSSWLKKTRDDGKPGEWLQPHIYEELSRYWDADEFKAISEQEKKARGSLKGGSLHTGGAKSVETISREMQEYKRYVRELGNDVELTPKLSHQIWTEKVVGRSHKGRIYEMGPRNDI